MMKCQIRVPSNGSIDANAGRTAMDRQLRGDYCIPHRHLFERQNSRRLAAAASMCAQCHQNLNSKQASGTKKQQKRKRKRDAAFPNVCDIFFGGPEQVFLSRLDCAECDGGVGVFASLQLGNIQSYAKG